MNLNIRKIIWNAKDENKIDGGFIKIRKRGEIEILRGISLS